MNKALLDTDILSELFKGINLTVGRNASAYRRAFGHLTLSAITVMEIVSGLQRVQSPSRIQKFMSNISGEEVLWRHVKVAFRFAKGETWTPAALNGNLLLNHAASTDLGEDLKRIDPPVRLNVAPSTVILNS